MDEQTNNLIIKNNYVVEFILYYLFSALIYI